MFASRFLGLALATSWVTLAGCGDSAPQEMPQQNTPSAESVRAAARKPTSLAFVNADVQISPAAKSQLARIADQSLGTQVRLKFTPEGCTGMKTHLELEFGPFTRPQDSIQDCGGAFCVFLTEQFPLVQGALIDWKEKEKGFAVTFPNKTRENQVKTTKWINEESEKRLKKWNEQDRLSGRLAERMTEFRKLAADDPENELGHFRLGQLLMEDGQHAEAVKSFERTVMLSPEFSKAYQLLGECLITLDQKPRAIEVLSKGWAIADKRGDEVPRDTIAKLLVSLAAPIPQSKK